MLIFLLTSYVNYYRVWVLKNEFEEVIIFSQKQVLKKFSISNRNYSGLKKSLIFKLIAKDNVA